MSAPRIIISFVAGFLLSMLLFGKQLDPWSMLPAGARLALGGPAPTNDSNVAQPSINDSPLAGPLVVETTSSSDNISNVLVGPPSQTADDAVVFTKLAHFCTDKTTDHQYQNLYSKVLAPYRHPPQHVVDAYTASTTTPGDDDSSKKKKKPYKLLEIGLGCNMKCAAGGFRLLQAYLPLVEYHAFELDFKRCVRHYKKSGMTPVDAAYLDSHICVGSSASKEDVARCAEKFGPFDIVIDDASHLQHHVLAGVEIWLPSTFLKAGGTYIIEDLQTGFWPEYGGSVENQLAGKTGPEFVKDVIDLKLAWNPHTNGKHGLTTFAKEKSPERIALAKLILDVMCSSEICAFTKR